jgi:hypothetical protein
MYECGKDDDHVWLGGRNAEQIRRQNVDCPCFLDFGLLSSDAVDSLRGRYPIVPIYREVAYPGDLPCGISYNTSPDKIANEQTSRRKRASKQYS